jgi:hypothetical protein
MARQVQFLACRGKPVLVSAQHAITDSYPVEASGWDSAHSFFVEKSELEWSEETGKQVTLTRSLSPGSMIFLRLLQPMSPDRSLPVAYHAQPMGVTPEGQQQFRLSQIQPNSGSKDKS